MSQVSIIGPTATNVIVKLDKASQLSYEYKFSNEFTFSNMIWKVACKEARAFLSFLIYSTNKTLHRNRGFKIMIKIPAKKEGQDVFVEARRHFGNKATCFTWTCDRAAIWSNCVIGETLVIDVAIQIMADDKILSEIGSDFKDENEVSLFRTQGSLTGQHTESFDWKAVGLSLISAEGKFSPEYSFRNQIWETSVCKSGNIYAVKINCNRERRGSTCGSILARIQVILKSIAGGSNGQAVCVEGARSFSSPDDSMSWSFDKVIHGMILEDSIIVTTRITVYSFTSHMNGHVNGNGCSSLTGAGDAMLTGSGSNGTVPASVPMTNAPFPPDISFVVGQGEVIQVHKGVLIARAPYFREKMNTLLSEIRLPDMKSSEALALVRYMYTNEVKCEDEDLLLTIKAAEKFGMTDFVAKCRPVITPENVLKFLDPKKNSFIINDCWSVIDQQFELVAQNPDFVKVSPAILTAILKRDSLSCPEIRIYDAVVEWSKNQCEEKKLPVTVENQKEVLKNILPLVRFPVMTGTEFSSGPATHGLLEQSDIINCFLYLTSKAISPTLIFSTQERNSEEM